MILLVDAGNSLTKWRVLERGRVRGEGHLSSAGLPECASPPWGGFAVRDAVIASVAGPVLDAVLRGWLDSDRISARWLVPDFSSYGIINRYEAPERLGADRYAALIAARRMDLGDCVVVCVGTALTADALSASGEFLGGCIAPGPDWMRRALHLGTAGVRGDGGVFTALPRDTGSAVATGAAYAMVGVVEGVRAAFPGGADRVPVVLSGGARSLLVGLLRAPCREVDNIVLEGLRWIAKDLGCDV
ncbi:MAG: type III pantothenate kinase [Betaproteobacteria bacterium]|nr:type III pantothenate kinase [Betaproteobacteria bacterium]